MLGKCFFILCAISLICAAFTGNLGELSNAVVDGAGRAVTLVIELTGMMCLWCGVMKVLSEAGIIRIMSRLLSPVLRLAFPGAWKNGIAKEEITASVSANVLGIGNAATPFALRAMAKMQEKNGTPDTATNDMVTLCVLGCSSLDILPVTLITLRRNYGSAAPYEIIVPVMICSLVCAVCGIIMSRLLAGVSAHD